MGILDKWCAAVSEMLDAGRKVSSAVTTHSTLLGDAREVLVRDVLRRLLPPNVHVGSGQIVDVKGHYSRQVDVVLYRSDYPVFRTLGTADVYLLEGVIATIEVKSTLTSDTLSEALENCRSVKSLTVNLAPASLDQYTMSRFGKSAHALAPFESYALMKSGSS